MATATNVIEEAHRAIDQFPANANWDDVLYSLVERKEIELGLSDSKAGRTTSVEDVMKEFYMAQFPKCMHRLLIAAARQARGDALPTMPMRWNHLR